MKATEQTPKGAGSDCKAKSVKNILDSKNWDRLKRFLEMAKKKQGVNFHSDPSWTKYRSYYLAINSIKPNISATAFVNRDYERKYLLESNITWSY